MTNEDREVMFDMIRRCDCAFVIIVDSDGFEGFCDIDEKMTNAIIEMLRVHPGLLDSMKFCINVIERERILN